jgi:glutaminase
LKEVQATRAQIGQKVQIKTPENPKGAFYAVGDAMGKFTIKTITKEFVEFSLDWKGQELTAKLPRK